MLQWWWIWRLHSEDPGTVRRAARKLGRYHNRRAAEALLPYLKCHDTLPEAARALGYIGDPLAVEPLVSVLETQTPYSDDKVAAAEALGRFRDSRASPVLFAHLLHVSHEVRKAAAGALAHTGWRSRDDRERALFLVAEQRWAEVVELGEVAVEPLLFAWDHSRLAAALDAVVEIGRPAIDGLLGWLRHEHSSLRHNRHADLVSAIQRIGVTLGESVESSDASGRQLILDALRELLPHEHDDLRREAAQALVVLKWSATSDTDRALLAYALEQWTEAVSLGRHSVSLLARIAANKKVSRHDRQEALVQIGHIRTPAALKALEQVATIVRVPDGAFWLTESFLGDVVAQALVDLNDPLRALPCLSILLSSSGSSAATFKALTSLCNHQDAIALRRTVIESAADKPTEATFRSRLMAAFDALSRKGHASLDSRGEMLVQQVPRLEIVFHEAITHTIYGGINNYDSWDERYSKDDDEVVVDEPDWVEVIEAHHLAH